MEPNENDFASPTFDFFPPSNKPESYSFLGVEMTAEGPSLVDRLQKRFSRRHYAVIPRGAISSVYENDLGGWSINFSNKVVYLGAFLGGHQIRINGEDESRSFCYDEVAIIKNKKRVVWENWDLSTRSRKRFSISFSIPNQLVP